MKAALYARFSTEKQSEASIDDQLRVCERIAERHGFKVVARFSDAAISGGTVERPGYRALLAAARRHDFDVIVAEDTSRLWRLLAEQAPRLAELADLGVHVVTHDLDTRQESAALLGAVMGSMAEQYRKEIGRRTRRGLEGRARAGKCAGGRAYGYLPPALSGTGRIEVDQEQAKVVRQVFTWYAEGWSARAIAVELNRRGVPSPGASWKRTERRTRGWLISAIAGAPVRGIGILNNDMYRGRVIWNRTRWVRSASDSSRRRCVLNPAAEWVTRDDERLRIVPQELWDRVKARQRRRSATIGEKIKAGVRRDRAGRTGREPKYAFSGLLRCCDCGQNFVMAGKHHYACSSRIYGGTAACNNDAYLPREVIEPGIAAGIKNALLITEVIDDLERRVRARLKDLVPPAADRRGEIAKVEREVANLAEAIAGGGLRSSTALAERLQAAESQLAALRARRRPASVEQLLPQLTRRCRESLEDLEHTIAEEPRRAREELMEHVGPIRVRTTPKEIVLEAEDGYLESALLSAAGVAARRQISLVAGAGFRHYLPAYRA